MTMLCRIALCFINYGPYHLARLKACRAEGMAVTGLQLAPLQSEYQWTSASENVISVFNGQLEDLSSREWPDRVFACLDELNPEVCAVAGYSHPGILSMLAWCVKRRKPVVIMSDSRYDDELRSKWKELMKTFIIGNCSAGLVAGTPHIDYLESLGMVRERIFTGYDVVDNKYFEQRAAESRARAEKLRLTHGLPENYFLASARFIEKKNLARLLQAYAGYRTLCASRSVLSWHLVLLGDGPLKSDLVRLVSDLGLGSFVILPGFIQYEQLPVYYSLGQAFILPSHKSEQWGLVVNEAMASGLPVLVSRSAGCARDLVHEGRNGFTFDPTDIEALATVLSNFANMTGEARNEMGAQSREIISAWDLGRFALGLREAVDCARKSPRTPSRLNPIFLRFLGSFR